MGEKDLEIKRMENIKTFVDTLKEADTWSDSPSDTILHSTSDNNKSRFRNTWYTIIAGYFDLLVMHGVKFTPQLTDSVSKFKKEVCTAAFSQRDKTNDDVMRGGRILDAILAELKNQGYIE